MLAGTDNKEAAFYRTGSTTEPFGELAFRAGAARVLCGQDAVESNLMRKTNAYNVITATLPQLAFFSYTVSCPRCLQCT